MMSGTSFTILFITLLTFIKAIKEEEGLYSFGYTLVSTLLLASFLLNTGLVRPF